MFTVPKVKSNIYASKASPFAATPALFTKTSIDVYFSFILGMKD